MNAVSPRAYAVAYGSAFANSQARPTPLAPVAADPCSRLGAIADAWVEVIEQWSCTVQDVIRLSTLAADLVGLADLAPGVTLGMAPHLPLHSPALRHAFFVAVLGIHLGRTVRLDAVRQHAIAKAALFMNLPAIELQDDLSAPYASPNDAQRLTLTRHPRLAADLLRDSPGADWRWIEAVEQHHETLDGSGYPGGLRGDEICTEARVLRVADVWCALVAPTRYLRAPKPPREALHWLLTRSRQCFDPALLEALRRLNGHFPPGTIVRLANRDTGIVVDVPHPAVAPQRVIAFMGAHGRLFRDPVRRDTRRASYAIRGITTLPLRDIEPDYWNRIWSLAGAR